MFDTSPVTYRHILTDGYVFLEQVRRAGSYKVASVHTLLMLSIIVTETEIFGEKNNTNLLEMNGIRS